MFLSSLLRSLISKEAFFSLNKLNNVVNMFINDSFVDNIDTKDLVDLGQSLQGVAAGRVTFLTVPTTGFTDEDGNEVPRDDDIRAIFDAIINDDPLPGEKNADNTPGAQHTRSRRVRRPTPTPTPTPRPDHRARRRRHHRPATSPCRCRTRPARTGLGSTAGRELQQHGFNVDTPDDYSGS